MEDIPLCAIDMSALMQAVGNYIALARKRRSRRR
jgi:hypothetical protein